VTSPYDTTDYSSLDVQNDNEDDGDKDLSAGDFVIVSFAGKTKSYNCIGLVEKVEGAEISAKFQRQSCKKSVDGKPIFTFKENDGVIPRVDMLKKLPTPKNLVVQPEGSRSLYSPAGLTNGMLGSRPDPDNLDLQGIIWRSGEMGMPHQCLTNCHLFNLAKTDFSF